MCTLKVVEHPSLDGAQHTTEVKNQQFNGKPNFRFGEMKIAIAHTINQSLIISSVRGIQKGVWMLVIFFQNLYLFCFFFSLNNILNVNFRCRCLSRWFWRPFDDARRISMVATWNWYVTNSTVFMNKREIFAKFYVF